MPGDIGSQLGLAGSVSILWLGQIASLICKFHVCVTAYEIILADLSPRYPLSLSSHTGYWNSCIHGAMRGVTVSTSAYLACHQSYCVGLHLAWGFNLQALVCGIFWSLSPGVFSGYSGFLPSFIGSWFSKWNKAQINAIETLSNLISWAVPSYQVARNMTCCTW